jgi:hypothetical protein
MPGQKTIRLKLPSLGIKQAEFIGLPFGRRIEPRRAIETWKATARQTHLSQKRQSAAKAIREFCELNNVAEYFCEFWDQPEYKDDSFEFFYTV